MSAERVEIPELPVWVRACIEGREVVEMLVDVLWLAGFSNAAIAKSLNMTRSKAAGIIARGPYPRRVDMTVGERQERLDWLHDEDVLHDLLPNFPWRVILP